MTDEFKVKTHEAFGRVKTVFAGAEKDARTFIQNNYPRFHVEPGTDKDDTPVPNVELHTPSGGVEHFNGDDWIDTKATADVPAHAAPTDETEV